MKTSISHLLSFKKTGNCIFAVFGFFIILFFTRNSGIGISPDSIVYLSVARNMVANGAFVDYNLQPLVDFPVLFPFFLSVSSFITRIDPVAFAPYLNGIIFASCIFLTAYLIDLSELKTSIYKYILMFCLTFSPALIDIYTMLWSETLFIVFTLFFFIAVHKYQSSRSLHWLLYCAVIAGLAAVTRYAGITVIATGMLLLFFDPSLHLRKKVLHFILFTVVSNAFLVANLVRNSMITGLMTGPRESGITSLFTNITFYTNVVCSWLSITTQQLSFCTLLVVTLFIIMVILFLHSAVMNNKYATVPNIFRAFFIVYTVFIIGISTLSHFEQINNRLLSPLVIPLMVILTYWIPGYLAHLKGKTHTIAVIFLSLIVFCFELVQLQQLYKEYKEDSTYGIPGYTDLSWQKSDIVRFLKSHPGALNKKYSIYSNAHEAAYFNGGLQASSIPHQIDKADIRDFFNDSGQYIIWFHHVDDRELITLSQISAHARVIKKYEFKDGAIYFIIPQHIN